MSGLTGGGSGFILSNDDRMKNRTTRQVLAVMVVATALCADHAASAAPVVAHRSPAPGLARSLASRLTGNLSRAVHATRFEPARRDGEQTVSRLAFVTHADPLVYDASASPFQFRLPPPTL